MAYTIYFYSIHPKGIHLASADLLMKEGTNLDHQVFMCVCIRVYVCDVYHSSSLQIAIQTATPSTLAT